MPGRTGRSEAPRTRPARLLRAAFEVGGEQAVAPRTPLAPRRLRLQLTGTLVEPEHLALPAEQVKLCDCGFRGRAHGQGTEVCPQPDAGAKWTRSGVQALSTCVCAIMSCGARFELSRSGHRSQTNHAKLPTIGTKPSAPRIPGRRAGPVPDTIGRRAATGCAANHEGEVTDVHDSGGRRGRAADAH